MSSRPTRLAAPAPRIRAASGRSPRASAARHSASTQPRPPQPQSGPSNWRVWWPNSPAPRPRPPVHPAAQDQPGAQPRTEVEVGEVAAARAPRGQRQGEGGGVGVLVQGDREAGALGEGGAQRVAVPLREAGDPAQDAVPVVERAGHGDAHAQHRLVRFGGAQVVDRVGRAREHPVGRGAEVEGRPGDRDRPKPARSTSTAVSPSRSRCRPTANCASGTSRSTVRGLPPVEGRRPAPTASPSSRSRAVILLTACGVRPVPSASSSKADALRPGRPQQVQDQRRVVVAQSKQVRPPPGPSCGSRSQLTPLHHPIVPVACTSATALLKWKA